MDTRKNIRLTNYDYSQNGAYFITTCVEGRRQILSKINENNEIYLTDIGKYVEDAILSISRIYASISVEKYVIMPNHVHMILVINSYAGEQCSPLHITSDAEPSVSISRIIKQFKGAVSKKLGTSIWQKSYFDHIIRTEHDYLEVWRYIDENPIKWEEDELYI